MFEIVDIIFLLITSPLTVRSTHLIVISENLFGNGSFYKFPLELNLCIFCAIFPCFCKHSKCEFGWTRPFSEVYSYFNRFLQGTKIIYAVLHSERNSVSIAKSRYVQIDLEFSLDISHQLTDPFPLPFGWCNMWTLP